MRALRVLGLADGVQGSSRNLLLEDPATGEQFSTRCDDRLIAATRGDLSRFGQLEIEMESQLRPKEIQARIRAGATVEQIAALAGTSLSRVERFAYPVLLERASVVERALKARPAIDGITGGASVAETVSATLAARGHDGTMVWDAYKDDDGWVLTLTWSAGRSENRAHWLFHPGPDGGTLSARDEAAAEIVDPALRILRPLRQVRPHPSTPALLDPTQPTESLHRPSEAASRSAHPAGGKLKPSAGRGEGRPEQPPARPTPGSTRFGRQPLPTSLTAGGLAERIAEPVGNAVLQETVLQETVVHETALDQTVLDRTVLDRTVLDQTVLDQNALHETAVRDRVTEDLLLDERSGVTPVVVPVEVARTGTEPGTRGLPESVPTGLARPAAPSRPAPARTPGTARSAKRGNRPAMPSWEDVLLGTRSDRTAGR